MMSKNGCLTLPEYPFYIISIRDMFESVCSYVFKSIDLKGVLILNESYGLHTNS